MLLQYATTVQCYTLNEYTRALFLAVKDRLIPYSVAGVIFLVAILIFHAVTSGQRRPT